MDNESQFLIYNTEDGHDRVELRLDGDTVWLTQKQIAELFDTSVQNVSAHINNILTDLELTESATIKEYLIVQNEGAREINRSVTHYNLDMILAVGYRVRSPRGVQFRRWANTVLKEFLTKGFAMDDVRLKDGGDLQYFKELLARIRDIRSSEKVLYAQLLDIFSTSIDYNKDSPVAKQFFATVQNKLHYAASGHTAAEIIAARADSTKLNMGLTTFANLPTKMEDWQKRLDNVLELSEYDVLQGNGSVTKKFADDKAKSEYKKFNVDRNNQLLSQAEIDFLSVIKQLPKDTK